MMIDLDNEEVIALANLVTGNSVDINRYGSGSALQRAARKVDAAAMDVVNGDRAERYEAPQPKKSVLFREGAPLYLVLGDVADSREFARRESLDPRRCFATSTPDALRGHSGPILAVRWRDNYSRGRRDYDALAHVPLINITATLAQLEEAKSFPLFHGRLIEDLAVL